MVRPDECQERVRQRKKVTSLNVRKLRVSKFKRKFKRLATPMKMPLEEILDIASKRHKE